MKFSSLFLLLFTLLLPLAYADDAIEQDVSRLYAGMDTSALDNPAQNDSGSTSDNPASTANGILHFDFAYGAESGMYGPIQFILTKRNAKRLERKIAKDENKLASSGNMSLKVLVRLEMNRQLLSKLKASPRFSSGKGCKVYFDVAELFEKANSDADFNRTLVVAAARTMGDDSLARAAQSGDYSGISGGAIASSVSSNVRNSVQSSVRSSVQQSVQSTVSQAAAQAASTSSGVTQGASGDKSGTGSKH